MDHNPVALPHLEVEKASVMRVERFPFERYAVEVRSLVRRQDLSAALVGLTRGHATHDNE